MQDEDVRSVLPAVHHGVQIGNFLQQKTMTKRRIQKKEKITLKKKSAIKKTKKQKDDDDIMKRATIEKTTEKDKIRRFRGKPRR